MHIAGSVVLRNMKDSDYFVRAAPGLRAPVDVPLRDGEVIVGWFVNPPPFAEFFVVFTDVALIAGTKEAHRRIDYANILSLAYPGKTGETWKLELATVGGSEVIVIGGAIREGSTALNSYCLAAALRRLMA